MAKGEDNFMLSLDDLYDADTFFQDEEEIETQEDTETSEDIEKENVTEENQLFEDEDNPENVGDEKNTENGNTDSENADSSSPNTYSSIASSFKEDGVPLFSDADDEAIKNITDSSSFREFMETQIEKAVNERFEDSQKRILEALNYGTNPSDIQLFESSLSDLNSIKEEDIKDESERGENLRKQLIYTDYINRGFSKERAQKKTQQSFDNGTDVEDAKDALSSNINFYETKYQEILDKNKEESQKRQEQAKKDAAALKKAILEDADGFGGFEVSDTIRKKVYETINKPVYRSDDKKETMTALQKYAHDHPSEFMKYMGYFYVVTEGFEKLGNIEKSIERKASKKQMNAFERVVNSSNKSGGNMRFVSGSSNVTQNWQLDI